MTKTEAQTARMMGRYKPPRQLENIQPGFGHWLAGLTDGEGHFSLYTRTCSGRLYITPLFRIALREDDKPTLDRIEEILRFGNVYRHGKAEGNRNGSYAYQVQGCDCAALVELFRRFTLWSKKQKDFEIWSQAVDLTVWWPCTPGRQQELFRLHNELKRGRTLTGASRHS